MTAHKHAEMIKAKADNMELVVFSNNYGQWEFGDLNNLVDLDALPAFLCLPQHKEACLHWLNGGEVQHKSSTMEWTDYGINYVDVLFSLNLSWLDESYEIRIKHRKEKRWIAIKLDNFYVLPRHYETKEGAKKAAESTMMGEFQYKEIEVEV